eukprot:TRINITY_DN2307_c0_g2_i1.p1 TRINITY_DN2307_c0_g2~~TRINITY_DN2307_c0_g2_i1.p1  ORF type:complete len:463 (+),score=117.56 TRINITY_DN2307_c0_g2_i1:35-1423(+)
MNNFTDGSEASTIPPMVDFDDNLPLETDFFDFRVISAPPMFDNEEQLESNNSFPSGLSFYDDSNYFSARFSGGTQFSFENDFTIPKYNETVNVKPPGLGNVLDNTSENIFNEPLEDTDVVENSNKVLIDMILVEHSYHVIQGLIDENEISLLCDILLEVLPEVSIKMLDDTSGQSVFQNLLEFSAHDSSLLSSVIFGMASCLPMICKHVQGTRIVQKLIDYCSNQCLLDNIICALETDGYSLMQDTNGHHVIQKLFQVASPESMKSLHDICIEKANSLSYDRHGCCVMQKALQYADLETKEAIINNLKPSVRELVVHPFGNYVVQFIFNLASDESELQHDVFDILYSLKGQYVALSLQKCSSNVIEKTIPLPYLSRDFKRQIILEFLEYPKFIDLLRHQFANYVIQKCIRCADDDLKERFRDMINPMLDTIPQVIQRKLSDLLNNSGGYRYSKTPRKNKNRY